MGKLVDLTGETFERLTVKQRSEYAGRGREVYWDVVCSCNPTQEFSVNGCSLRSGRTKSCGCLQRSVGKGNVVDLTGRKFGRLTVISRAGSYKLAKMSQATWNVKCDCGIEKVVKGSVMTRGDTQSCGCLHREVISLPLGESMRNAILANYINNAKTRNLCWDLSDTQFFDLVQANCHYCDAPPSTESSRKGHNGVYTYNGVDRVDNAQGYLIGNVVSCCKVCNRAKGTMGYGEYKAFLIRAGKFQLQQSTVG